MDHDSPRQGLHRVRNANRSSRQRIVLIVEHLRRPLIAYLAIISIAAVGAAGYQSHQNYLFQKNDYKSCMRAMRLVKEGNKIRARHGEVQIPFKENCRKLKP